MLTWINSSPFFYFFFVCDLIDLHFPLSTLLCLYFSSTVSCHALGSISNRQDLCNHLLWLPLLGRAEAEAWAGGGFCQLQAGSHCSCQWLQYLIFCWRDPWAPRLYGNNITLTWEMFQSRTNVFSRSVSPRISSIPLWWLWWVTLPALGTLEPFPWGAWGHIPLVLWAIHFRFYGIVRKKWSS